MKTKFFQASYPLKISKIIIPKDQMSQALELTLIKYSGAANLYVIPTIRVTFVMPSSRNLLVPKSANFAYRYLSNKTFVYFISRCIIFLK